MATLDCQHCGTPILDRATMVDHGGAVYCCVNCAGAMEQSGSGSDPHSPHHEPDLHCVHCGAPIADESTMRSLGDDAFCCDNCFQIAA